jgi:Mn2+/Fe2+ NRAMP family transporter
VVNGVIAVPIMAVMMWLGTKRELLGDYTLSLRHRVLGWFATVVMGAAVIAMFVLH